MTQQPRLVKPTQTQQAAVILPKKITCTNWAAEFRAEKDGRPSAQQQFRNLFRAEFNSKAIAATVAGTSELPAGVGELDIEDFVKEFYLK